MLVAGEAVAEAVQVEGGKVVTDLYITGGYLEPYSAFLEWVNE